MSETGFWRIKVVCKHYNENITEHLLVDSYFSYQMLTKKKRDLVLNKIWVVVEFNSVKITVPHKVRLYFARK